MSTFEHTKLRIIAGYSRHIQGSTVMIEERKRIPRIAISMGDPNGIGPEIILKSLTDSRLAKNFVPIIIGSVDVINAYLKELNLNLPPLRVIHSISAAEENHLNIFESGNRSFTLNQGDPESGGHEAFAALKLAAEVAMRKEVDGLVTAPLNKANISAFNKGFTGHTGYLAEVDNNNALMILASEEMRIAMVTGHIPLSEVASEITGEKIERAILSLSASLKLDFQIEKPEIAVLGLNPHAGESGLLGKEEIDVISPIIHKLNEAGQKIKGPFPADGFFGMKSYRNFDGIVSMYHDQGLISFKTVSFENGVNFTAGLSFIRTSPDHGTAFDLAGKNCASPESMIHSILMALDIRESRNRFRSENQ